MKYIYTLGSTSGYYLTQYNKLSRGFLEGWVTLERFIERTEEIKLILQKIKEKKPYQAIVLKDGKYFDTCSRAHFNNHYKNQKQ